MAITRRFPVFFSINVNVSEEVAPLEPENVARPQAKERGAGDKQTKTIITVLVQVPDQAEH